ITVIFFFVFIVFLANSVISYSVLVAFALASMFTTRIPIRFILKGLTPVWILIVFTFILHLIVTNKGTVLIDIFGFSINSGGINLDFVISYCIYMLIL